jgi:hypothetical protein
MSLASARAVITGLIEPCYDDGGDCFDCAANGADGARSAFGVFPRQQWRATGAAFQGGG